MSVSKALAALPASLDPAREDPGSTLDEPQCGGETVMEEADPRGAWPVGPPCRVRRGFSVRGKVRTEPVLGKRLSRGRTGNARVSPKAQRGHTAVEEGKASLHTGADAEQ